MNTAQVIMNKYNPRTDAGKNSYKKNFDGKVKQSRDYLSATSHASQSK